MKESNQNIKIGISACLLGEGVRYDGGHKRSVFCTEQLSEYVDFVPLCPEVGIGLPVPRPTIRLEDHDSNIIAKSADGTDVTRSLRQFGKEATSKIKGVSGYIFCAKSPSCGMERVKVYQGDSKMNSATGIGIFAEELMRNHPLLPVEENGRLNDALLRETFISRVYAYSHWQAIEARGITKESLIDFHSQYKYFLMAHDLAAYKTLGKLLADLSGGVANIADGYISEFMKSISKPISRKHHSNVLQHIQGYFKKDLSSAQRQEFAAVIKDYREGMLPLLAPLTLIRHFLAEYPDPYLEKQRYLQPYPVTMNLRYGL